MLESYLGSKTGPRGFQWDYMMFSFGLIFFSSDSKKNACVSNWDSNWTPPGLQKRK